MTANSTYASKHIIGIVPQPPLLLLPVNVERHDWNILVIFTIGIVFIPPIRIPEKTDFKVVVDSSANSAAIALDYSFILVNNNKRDTKLDVDGVL